MDLYSANIERAILSAIIFDNDKFNDVDGVLDVDSFYFQLHRTIFEIMIELDAAKKPICEEFIISGLMKKEVFDEQGFLELLSSNPVTDIDAYASELNELSKRRLLVNLSIKSKQLASESDDDSDTILAAVSSELDKIMDVGAVNGLFGMDTIIKKLEQKMSEAVDHGNIVGYKTGINSLDTMIGGFEPGDLVMIAARPSMGKTSLATEIVEYSLNHGVGVLFDSLEMDSYKIMRRLISARSDESITNIKRGLVRDFAKFKEAKEFYLKAPLHLHDKSYIPIAQLRAKAIKIFRKNPNVKLWVIDHLRYIKLPGLNIPQELSAAMKVLKATAKEYGVVVIALSQLNRANESRVNKRPMLSDLRDSGAVEEDADVVIFCHRESYYRRAESEREPDVAEAELIVGKNRDGATGVNKCYFDAPHARFQNISYGYNTNETHGMPTI
ncbi:MAG: DnaB-like helicase C-terminal domain-containing protein [Sulfurovaceae bacterium]|nr:DnaB-like helicase C-terminal domain-containing protein [Sulfurovaceae bacterium]